MGAADTDRGTDARASAGTPPSLAALPCDGFVEALASKAPVPGGGGAAALVGAIGAALGNMVGSLTIGKPRYADVEQDVALLKEQTDALQDALLSLVEQDAEAFLPLSRAYGLPKGNDAERTHRTEVMEECLCTCCAVPLQIMEKCCEAIGLHEQFAAKGAALAISDVGCGAVCCKAALQAASLNVLANTALMQNRSHAEEVDREARALLEEYVPRADALFAEVSVRLAAPSA
ncbi:MAG: cyclodeaminase/cyclohydrolase family protein [Coriobacteriales bacterium]|jgi:formiminotetrahydrofolate cyclodeaminase|nr:cyclodeaminase/cyclohydrolase family protein [Coriobacteriales bacterium]